jgi:hypothetical protein
MRGACRYARAFAAEGCPVTVPDLFNRGSWFSCVKKVMAGNVSYEPAPAGCKATLNRFSKKASIF